MRITKTSGFIRAFCAFALTALLMAAQPAHAQSLDLLALPGPGQSVTQTSPQTYTLPGYGQVRVSWQILSDSTGQQATVWSRTIATLDNKTLPGSPSIVLPAAVRMLVIRPPYAGAANRANGTVSFTFLGTGQPDLSRLQLLVDNLGTVAPTTVPTPFQRTTITPSVALTQYGTLNHNSTGTDMVTMVGGVIQNAGSSTLPATNSGLGNFRLNTSLPPDVDGNPTLTLTLSQNFNDEIAISLGYSTEPDIIVTEGPTTDVPTMVTPPDPCCPPWSEQTLQESFVYFSTGNIGAPYTLRWQPSASLNAQMQAYINYLNAVDPSITSITIAFGVFPAGAGPAPGTAGLQLGGTGGNRLVTWTAGGSAPSVPANFFPNGWLNTGQWYTVGTTIFLNDGLTFFPETCAQNAISVRVQVTPGVRPAEGPTARSANAPLEVRMAPRSVGPAVPARRARPQAR